MIAKQNMTIQTRKSYVSGEMLIVVLNVKATETSIANTIQNSFSSGRTEALFDPLSDSVALI